MTRRRVPWWLFTIAASFCGYFTLLIYSDFCGSESPGFKPDFVNGRMVLRDVAPDSPGMRAGLEPGDHVLAVEGQPIHSRADWITARANFEVGRPRRLVIGRGDKRFDVLMTLARESWGQKQRYEQLISIASCVASLTTLLLALVIAFNRPSDSAALLGAWALADAGLSIISSPPQFGLALAWRHLPTFLGGFLWIAFLGLNFWAPVSLSFTALFPRKLFRSSWPLWLVWFAWIPGVLLPVLYFWRIVYQPGRPVFVLQNLNSSVKALGYLYLVATLLVLVVNYRRLEDVGERRKLRVLVVGTVVGILAYFPIAFIDLFPQFSRTLFSTPVPLAGYLLFLLMPASVAYSLLRHRLFDIRVMLRQGLRYALARGFVLSGVPLLAVILSLDLWWHADQPLVSILHTRGGVYASLVGLALLAYKQRRKWLESLDRRFFRDRYDAQQLLREVVDEIRAAHGFEEEAMRIVTRIEAALHPQFAALLVREPHQPAYRTLTSAPVGHDPVVLPAESKLIALVRLLGKPLEMPHSDSGWLQEKLPHDEIQILRGARIDLLVPVATSRERNEALLVLGTKRSEEPYTSEDLDLLETIAVSLAILLEKPPVGMVLGRRDLFEECPQCGICYDSGITCCALDFVALVPVALPRLLGQRYRLERRIGRGGMGTVYEASDGALGRRVAVKVIRDELVESVEAAERFRREAQTAAAFAHPNVVTVYDFGLAAGNRPFLVMELLRGTTLRGELRKETRLAAARTLNILYGICAAMEAAHKRQLVHRDLKPENIFLLRGDSEEVAKVLDFGLAKFSPGMLQEATVDTGTGILVGTLRYMSPEQLQGAMATAASDLWALAVVAYEMLTGAYPFAGASAVELGRAIVAGEIMPLSVHVPAAPPSWQRFFEQALARDALLRPHSAEALFSELHSALV